MSKKVLIVGAGAVGTVYGHFIYQSGHEVTFFVKPHHATGLTGQIQFYEFKPFKKNPRSFIFNRYQVISDLNQLADKEFDLIVLSFASTAIDQNWFAGFFLKIKNAPLVLSLQPTLGDRQKILATGTIREQQLIMGTISIISYASPLPGESLNKGFAFILPPGAPMAVDRLLDKIVPYFDKSPLRVKLAKTGENLELGQLLLALIRVLELKNWSFSKFFAEDGHYLTSQSARQLVMINSHRLGVKISKKFSAISSPLAIKLIMITAKKLFSFNLEAYLRVHFTKVREQQSQAIQETIEYAQNHGLDTGAITR